MQNLIKIMLLWWLSGSVMASVPLAPRMGVNGKIDMFGCMQSNDYYIANFAVYPLSQLKDSKTPIVPYCQDTPFTGMSQLSLDLLDRDVRKKTVWLKVFDRHNTVVAQTQPSINKQGVLTTTVNFSGQGQYDVVLYVEDPDLNTDPQTTALHIPLAVALITPGPSASAGQWLWVVGGIAFIALSVGLITSSINKTKQAA